MQLNFRNKLLLAFAAFITLTVITVWLNAVFQQRSDSLHDFQVSANQTFRLLLSDYSVLITFQNNDQNNRTLYSTGTSETYERHINYLDSVERRLTLLQQEGDQVGFHAHELIAEIEQHLYDYRKEAEQLRIIMLKRGYEDFGLIGDMRKVIHKLEKYTEDDKSKVFMLTLRRHEKDYLLRKESKYIAKHEKTLSDYLEYLQGSQSGIIDSKLDSMSVWLTKYYNSFRQMVQLDEQIDDSSTKGLISILESEQKYLENLFNQLIDEAESRKEEQLLYIKILYGGMVSALLLIGIWLSLRLANMLTSPLILLSNYIQSFVQNGFVKSESENLPPINKDEIGALTGNFSILEEELNTYVEELKMQKKSADEANKSKSLFLANMSHEIRTPLNGVIGITQLLLDTPLNSQQEEYGLIISKSANNLLGIINDILDFSKIESGKLELEEIAFDLKEEIDSIFQLLAVQAASKGLKLEIVYPEFFDNHVVGDPVRLKQVITNLLHNAIKFTRKGHVILTVEQTNTTKEETTYKISVEDTGIGISPQTQDRLFKAFSQVDSSTTRNYGGTGLGLAISQRIIDKMKGEIGLHSVKGKGSRFWFTVPLKRQSIAMNPLAQQTKDQATTHQEEQFLHILVVEDNLINQKVILKMLQKMGHVVSVANNGQEGYQAYQKEEIDLILMDIQMPVMDGIEATRSIREWEKDHNFDPVYIIAVTANVTRQDQENAYGAGMNDFTTKPITKERLQEAIGKAKSSLSLS